jgi:hypothetical protein
MARKRQALHYQIATRLGIFDPESLRNKDNVFESVEEMLKFQYD